MRKILISLIAGFTLFTFSSLSALERLPWMPAESDAKGTSNLNIGGEQIIPQIYETKTPKMTADKSKFTRKYIIDLKKFKVSNEGKNPVATANGINAALKYAKDQKKNYILFPKGIYLISENIPIILDHQNTIIDLNGATLKINPNKLKKSGMVQIIDGAENLRLTNGVLLGDRYAHDYKSNKCSHEGHMLLIIRSGKNLEIDHIKFAKCAGFTIASNSYGSRTRPELLAKIMHQVLLKNLEQGGFSKAGKKIKSASKTRTIKPYETSKCKGEFEFGWTEGYQGYPCVKGRVYQVYFYDKNMNFVKMQKCLQFRKVKIPDRAHYMNLEFNQPKVFSERAHCGRITNFKPPTDVHFHNNHIYDNRVLGFAFCGGQKWLIEKNVFEKNGPDVVGWGIDFEDGWELMQDVILRNNRFKDNCRGDVVICAGSELLLENNEFTNNVHLHARPHNYIFRNNKFNNGRITYTTRTGIAKIHNNTYKNCSLSINFDTKAVADGLYRKPGENVVTPPLLLTDEKLSNIKKVTGTYFCFKNCNMDKVNFIAGNETRLIDFENCVFNNCSIEYKEKGPKIYTKINKCKGKIKQKGPGVKRQKK